MVKLFASSVSKLSETIIIAVLETVNDKPIWNDQTDIKLNHTRLTTWQMNSFSTKMTRRSLGYSLSFLIFSVNETNFMFVTIFLMIFS